MEGSLIPYEIGDPGVPKILGNWGPGSPISYENGDPGSPVWGSPFSLDTGRIPVTVPLRQATQIHHPVKKNHTETAAAQIRHPVKNHMETVACPHPTPAPRTAPKQAQKRSWEGRGILAVDPPPPEAHAARPFPRRQRSARGITPPTPTTDTKSTKTPLPAGAVAAGRAKNDTGANPQSTGATETEHTPGAPYIGILTNAVEIGSSVPPTHHTRMPGVHPDATHVTRAAGESTPHATVGRSMTAWDPHRHHLHPPSVIAAQNGMKISHHRPAVSPCNAPHCKPSDEVSSSTSPFSCPTHLN